MIDEFLLKLKNRRLVVLLTPLVVGSFLGIAMIIKPSLAKIFAFQSEIKALSKKTNAYDNILSKEKKLAEYRDRVSSAGKKTKVIDALNAAAGEAGLNIFSVVPEEGRPVTEYLRQDSVRMDAEGSYHQLGEFVSRVENMSDLVKIVSVDIFEDAPQEDGGIFAFPGGQPNPTAPSAQPKKHNGLHRMSISAGFFNAQIGGQA